MSLIPPHLFRAAALVTLPVVLLLFGAACCSAGAPPLLWEGLAPGPHAVGFEVLKRHDHARSFHPRIDFRGREDRSEIARPVQIAVWYPAQASAAPSYLTATDYLRVAATETDFTTPPGAAEITAPYRQALAARGWEAERIEELLARPARAIRRATRQPGSYPLILYAAGGGMSAVGNRVLCEYLASHGYIVAACGSHGMYGPRMTYDAIGLEAQVGDLEFAYAQMQGYPGVARRIVGTVGFSWGGLANVLAALRHLGIRAVACLDGQIAGRYRAAAEGNPFFEPDRQRAALMLLTSAPEEELDRHFYDGVRYADAYWLHFPDLPHIGFASWLLRQARLGAGPDQAERMERLTRAYGVACRQVRRFCDAYLKEDAAARAELQALAAAARDPEALFTGEMKVAQPAPPRPEEWLALVEEEGITAAAEVFRQAREHAPDQVLFDEGTMNRIGYRLLQAGQAAEAIAAFRLNTEAYPTSANVYDSLGEAYANAGNRPAAIENYRRSLEINPGNENAVRRLEALGDR